MDRLRAVKNSLVLFVRMVWRHLGLPEVTPIQEEVCWWLQWGPKRSQTRGFRGLGKSYLTAAYTLWLLLRNPDEMILIISASKDRADAFVQFTRRLINSMPVLQHLIPNRMRNDRDSTVLYDVGACTPKQSPSVKAIGITGALAGSRASTIILDDVEVANNSMTPTQREKLAELVKEVDAILLPDDPRTGVESRVRVLGTPQSMETIYLLLEERGYVPRVWPITVPDQATAAGYRGHLAPSIVKMMEEGVPEGASTEPTRFSQTDIEARRISYGALGFALQFMLSTSLSDAERYPLKTRDLIVADFNHERAQEHYVHSRHPQYQLRDIENYGMTGDGFFAARDCVGSWTGYDQTIVVVDPSGRGADETAIISGSQLGGYVFLHNLIASKDGYEETTLEMIAYEAKRIKAHKIVVEANFGDGMFTRLLQPVLKRIYPCQIEEVKTWTQKERRIIDTLSPVMEAHRLIVSREFIEKDYSLRHDTDSDMKARDRKLFYQLTHLTDEKGCLAHDDRLDALSLLVAAFAPAMSLDPQEEARRREMAEYEERQDTRNRLDSTWLESYNSESLLDSLLP